MRAIHLPFAQPAQPSRPFLVRNADQASGSGRAHALERPRILVVEDDFLLALRLEMLLSEAGYAVVGPVARLGEILGAGRDEAGVAQGRLERLEALFDGLCGRIRGGRGRGAVVGPHTPRHVVARRSNLPATDRTSPLISSAVSSARARGTGRPAADAMASATAAPRTAS